MNIHILKFPQSPFPFFCASWLIYTKENQSWVPFIPTLCPKRQVFVLFPFPSQKKTNNCILVIDFNIGPVFTIAVLLYDHENQR